MEIKEQKRKYKNCVRKKWRNKKRQIRQKLKWGSEI